LTELIFVYFASLTVRTFVSISDIAARPVRAAIGGAHRPWRPRPQFPGHMGGRERMAAFKAAVLGYRRDCGTVAARV
jgi:hypothetical protein